MRLRTILGSLFAVLVVIPLSGSDKVHITHEYANVDAQSLIGLPMGSEKTIVDKQGDLRWSQWSIRRREPEVPFGISQQMDGALDIRLFWASGPGKGALLKITGQDLYKGRFPFVVTHLEGAPGLAVEELAFPTLIQENGLDVIRVTLINSGAASLSVIARLSGKTRNNPAFADGSLLATHDGRVVALGEADKGEWSEEGGGLVMRYQVTVTAQSSQVIWLKRPHDLRKEERSVLVSKPGLNLLEEAEQSWKDLWNQGLKVELPEKEIEESLYSSIAYLFILTEHDAQGDLWTLDGPALYRHFWPRSEYYMALAMDMTGYPTIAGQTIEHLLNVQKDDGRWDMPLISSPFSWDALGDAAGTIRNHYLFVHDKQWLRQTYPHLISASRWIQYNREQTEMPSDAPEASKPVKPYLSYPCMEVPKPPLGPGEKPYTWGLLPMGYGDSGLPDDHAFSHNVMPLYALECARQAAIELKQPQDAEWLTKEYSDYKQAVLTAIQRAAKLEKEGPPYLPATPTYPRELRRRLFLRSTQLSFSLRMTRSLQDY